MTAARTAAPAVAMAVLLALAGCGSSSSHSIKNVSVSSSPTVAGAKTFDAPGIAIHFSYPSKFQAVTLQATSRVSGNASGATHAAVGIGPYDLLIVTRFPHRPIPVSAHNIGSLKHDFDAGMTSSFGNQMSGTVTTIRGLPALSYAPTRVLGLSVSATSRVTLVFNGDDEYELNCQYTAKGSTSVTAACAEMLATLST